MTLVVTVALFLAAWVSMFLALNGPPDWLKAWKKLPSSELEAEMRALRAEEARSPISLVADRNYQADAELWELLHETEPEYLAELGIEEPEYAKARKKDRENKREAYDTLAWIQHGKADSAGAPEDRRDGDPGNRRDLPRL